jgi:hypothetical protein
MNWAIPEDKNRSDALASFVFQHVPTTKTSKWSVALQTDRQHRIEASQVKEAKIFIIIV